ncbi:putative ribonuclease H-like domain-containing protein [Tanacetum coccineum]
MDTEGVSYLTRTMFIKRKKKDIMLVQVYVDDIIFGSTRKSWCDEFEALMKGRFQMSSMGELIFFLGLQVKQKTDGIFISQDKYVADMLKKFDLTSVKTVITPMETKMTLTKDEETDEVDVHLYRSMIGRGRILLCACVEINCALSLRFVKFALFAIEGVVIGLLAFGMIWQRVIAGFPCSSVGLHNSAPAGRPFRCVSDISELRLQEHWYMPLS